jgi:hypothetical protein
VAVRNVLADGAVSMKDKQRTAALINKTLNIHLRVAPTSTPRGMDEGGVTLVMASVQYGTRLVESILMINFPAGSHIAPLCFFLFVNNFIFVSKIQ